jgi:hypothetical protein
MRYVAKEGRCNNEAQNDQKQPSLSERTKTQQRRNKSFIMSRYPSASDFASRWSDAKLGNSHSLLRTLLDPNWASQPSLSHTIPARVLGIPYFVAYFGAHTEKSTHYQIFRIVHQKWKHRLHIRKSP